MTVVLIPCEVYSRVVGFLRPVSDWNEGKQQEFSERVAFTLPAKDQLVERVAKPQPSGFWLPDDWNKE